MWDWDEDKRQANLAKHGVDFADIDRFDWPLASEWIDVRFDYGEVRKVAVGTIDARLFVAVFTERGAFRRVISLRKANEREKRKWSIPAT